MKQRSDDVVFASGGDVFNAGYDLWPKYEKDAFVGKYPDAKIPVLILNGTLDSQTPIEIAEKVKTRYTAPNQTFVTVPNASHGVIMQSPMVAAPGAPPESCGMLITVSFMKNPTAPPDTSCLAQLAPVSFDRPPEEIAYLFGTTDLRVGVPTAAGEVPRSLVDVRRSPFVRLFDIR
jgi:hypothetical protein